MDTLLSYTNVSRNGIDCAARDLPSMLAGLSGPDSATPTTAAEDGSDVGLRTRIMTKCYLHPYRQRRIAATLTAGGDHVLVLPQASNAMEPLIDIIPVFGPSNVMQVGAHSVLGRTRAKGLIANLLSSLRAPPSKELTATYESGEHIEPLTMLLASLAAEHAVVPLTTPVIPVGAEACVLNLHMGNPRDARNCIRTPAQMRDLSGCGGECKGAWARILPVYVPFPAMDAMSIFSALSRNNGPYSPRVRSCYSISTEELRVIIVSHGGTGGMELKPVDPSSLWRGIAECLHILTTYNGAKVSTFYAYFSMFLHNTPIWDYTLAEDLAQVRLDARPHPPVPHEQRPRVPYSDDADLPPVPNGVDTARFFGDSGLVPPPGLADDALAAVGHMVMGTLAPATLRAPPGVDALLYAHRAPCTYFQVGPFIGDAGRRIAPLARCSAYNSLWTVDVEDFIWNQGAIPAFFPDEALRHADEWFFCGMAHALVTLVIDIDAIAPPAPVEDPRAPPVGSKAHLAQNHLLDIYNEAGALLPRFAELYHWEAPAPPTNPRLRVVVVTGPARSIWNATVTFFRDIRLNPDADVARFAPLPHGIVFPRPPAATYVPHEEEGASVWATRLLGYDAAEAAALVGILDESGLASFLSGHVIREAPNAACAQVCAYASLSLIYVRAAWENWVDRANDRWAEVAGDAPSYPSIAPRHCLFLGGVAITRTIPFRGGLWPLGLIPKPTKFSPEPMAPSVMWLSNPANIAELMLTMRACADAVGALFRTSRLGVERGPGRDSMPAFAHASLASEQRLDTTLPAADYLAATLRCMVSVASWTPAATMLAWLPDASSPHLLRPSLAGLSSHHAELCSAFKARVPQVLSSDLCTALLDCSFPEYRFEDSDTPLNIPANTGSVLAQQ